jgi:hypothetical protein
VLQNDYLVDSEVPESNAAAINEAEANYIEAGQSLDVILSYYSSIISVAMQCPYTGGEAVIRARTFAAMLNDSLAYDDANVCLQNGVYRISKADSSAQSANNIIVKPNPTTDKIDVILNGSFEGICSVEIVNTLNMIVFKQTKPCTEKYQTMDVSKLSQGIYTFKVSVTDGTILISKIAVIK